MSTINTTGSPDLLSDISVSDNKRVIRSTKRASVTSRKKGWADLDLSLPLHPYTKDIVTLKDDTAIRNSVKNLLLTNFYERPFNKNIGANLRGLLFEPADVLTEISLRENISKTIQKHEQRVEVKDIEIINEEENNSYRISVNFLIKEFDTDQSVEIVLRRLR
tara:strand:- start:1688 stop:2176 length:489 start_codon:yes stop_codon:yes gene_type:complete